MLTLEKITTMEQLQELQKGDMIVVRWDDYFVKHHEDTHSLMAYRIDKIQEHGQLEIICSIKGNHYFAADRYLYGKSHAEEVYRIKEAIQ